ncbi:MAG TPA: hypothetical protein VIF62_10365 [Labilithrix sp.]
MRPRVLLLSLLCGCGTVAGAPDDPIPEPVDAPGARAGFAPAAAPTSPANIAFLPPPAATGCTPQPLVTSPDGTATQYRSLALDGASLAFLEWVTWQKSTGTDDGQYLASVDLASGTKTRLAHFVGGAQSLAFDASAYYVGVWGNASATGDGLGSLVRVERGTNATTTIATDLSLSWSIASSADSLLYAARSADDSTVGLLAMSKDGGAAVEIGAGLDEGARILADADGIAWIETSGGMGHLERRAGDLTTELASGALVSKALARAGDTFYFADDQGVLAVPVAGGAVTRIAKAPRVLEIFADAKTVAWIQGPSYGGDLAVNDDAVLVAMPAAGGGAVTAAHVHSPHDLVADAASFYWVDNQTSIQHVCRPF